MPVPVSDAPKLVVQLFEQLHHGVQHDVLSELDSIHRKTIADATEPAFPYSPERKLLLVQERQ